MGASAPLGFSPALPGRVEGYRCMSPKPGKEHTNCPALLGLDLTVKWLAGFMACTVTLQELMELQG
eukprot:7979615-Prorocentrum_lima.AAC.1